MIALLFWAVWYPECEEMRREFEKLGRTLTHLRLFWCDVDRDKEIIDFYEVYKVPYVLILHPHKEDIEYIKNPRSSTIGKVMTAYEEYYNRLFQNERERDINYIDKKLMQFPIIVFMRGDP